MFDAYGDESCGSEYVTYGLILIPDSKSEAALAILDEVKAEFGGNKEYPLHCREIFAAHARQKSPWRDLSMDDACSLYRQLFVKLEQLQLRRIVGIAKISEFPAVFPGGPMTHIDPSYEGPSVATKDQKIGGKELASYCAMAAAIPLSKWPGLENVRFRPDPDNSSINWLTGRRKFTETLGGFVSAGPGREPPRINVVATRGPKPRPLEIADAIAWISQRALLQEKSPNGHRFRALFDMIAPERIRVAIGPDGGLAVNVPNASLEFRP